MRRGTSQDGRLLDLLSRAEQSDFHLTTAAPLWAHTELYPSPFPLYCDIHAGLEVGIVLTGREEMRLEGSVIQGAPGDVWLCAMWEPHAFHSPVPETTNVVLVFLPSFLGEEMLGDIPWLSLFAVPPSKRPRVSSPDIREAALAIGRELRHEIQRKDPGWQSLVRLDLLRLLLYLSRGWNPPSLRQPGRRGYAGSLRRIMPALTLVHEHNPETISVAQAACACGLGRSRFTTLFRQTAGVSFGKFRQRARLAYVAHLLRATGLSVEDIAAEAGFADSSHLHRSFVKYYGCTPGRYRDQADDAGCRK